MSNSNATRSQQSVCGQSVRNTIMRSPYDHSSRRRHHLSVDHPYASRHQATITPHNYPSVAQSVGISITNVSSRDEVNRILRPDVVLDNLQSRRSSQNWGNQSTSELSDDHYVTSDPYAWIRSLDDQEAHIEENVTSDPYAWIRSLEDQESYIEEKEEDAVLRYFKIRTHRVAAPKDEVNNPTEAEEICPICQVEFEQEETIGTLWCGHEYHSGCIKQWLLRKKDCPMCRASVLPSHQLDNHGLLN